MRSIKERNRRNWVFIKKKEEEKKLAVECGRVLSAQYQGPRIPLLFINNKNAVHMQECP